MTETNLDRKAIETIAAGSGYRLAVPEFGIDLDLSDWARALSALLDMQTDYSSAWYSVVKHRTNADLSLTASIERLANERNGLLAFKRSVDEALNMGDGSYRP